MIAVGFLCCRRALSPTHAEPGNYKCRNVREVVERVANQRDGMPGVACGQLDRDQKECSDDGSTQDASHALQRQMHMQMPTQAMAVAMIVSMAAVSFRMRLHRLNSTR